ncbi:hypothetical protein ACLOJK_008077 [Asimina triloba]
MHLLCTCYCHCFASTRDLLMDGWGFVLMDADLSAISDVLSAHLLLGACDHRSAGLSLCCLGRMLPGVVASLKVLTGSTEGGHWTLDLGRWVMLGSLMVAAQLGETGSSDEVLFGA